MRIASPILPISALVALSIACGADNGANGLSSGGANPGVTKTTVPPGTTITKTPPGGTTTPTSVKPPWTGGAPKGSVPMTGGTLLVTTAGTTAVAADPDRDQIAIVDLAKQKVLSQIQLPTGAEPGRLAEDGSGVVHVILRRGGGLADVDVATGKLLGLRQTCAIPRGIAYRHSDNTLIVACMTGELMTMSAEASKAGPIAVTSIQGPDGAIKDLRDVVIIGDSMFVSTFRSAQLLKVSYDGTLHGKPIALSKRADTSAAQLAAVGLSGGTPQNYVPEEGWKAVAGPMGDVVMVHEGGTDRVIDISDNGSGGTQIPMMTETMQTTNSSTSLQCTGGGYGGSVCTEVTTTTVGSVTTVVALPPICAPPILINLISSVSTDGVVSDGPSIPQGALPVDILPSRDGTTYTVALAGNPGGAKDADGNPLFNIVTLPAVNTAATAAASAARFDSDLCGSAFANSGVTVPGQVISLAEDANGQVIAQTREPATLQVLSASGILSIPLSGQSVADPGFDIFHTNTGRGMACAGCHAEGQDDGRTWLFADAFNADGTPVEVQPRRTQTFREGFLETAPFHWSGQFGDLSALMDDVFVHRMGAKAAPAAPEQAALEQWMNGVPSRMHDVPNAALAASIASGKALFEDSTVGCTKCHNGDNFTNNKNEDIGFAGGKLQTPSLIDVQFRAPYLHDGSVPSLLARFSDPTAKSGKHGKTADLAPIEIDNLIAYMESL